MTRDESNCWSEDEKEERLMAYMSYVDERDGDTIVHCQSTSLFNTDSFAIHNIIGLDRLRLVYDIGNPCGIHMESQQLQILGTENYPINSTQNERRDTLLCSRLDLSFLFSLQTSKR